MHTARQIRTEALPVLHRCCLIVDGNAHRPDLHRPQLPDTDNPILEAMLPQIRTVAQMIAASRHDFSGRSPEIFADEADWFAARILVLQARSFRLDISLKPMLETANRRARDFAARHNLPFVPAEIKMSLHAKRPGCLLISECAVEIPADGTDFIDNSRRLAGRLAQNLPFFS